MDECAEKYQWSRATKFNVQKELIEKTWVAKVGGGLMPLVGCFSPVSKSKNLDSVQSEKSKNLDSQSKKLDSKSKNLDSHIRKYQPLPAINQQEECSNEHLSDETPDGALSAQAISVFSFWQEELNHTQAKFTNERKRKVVARLKEKYTVEQLKEAISGCKKSAFHQGQNDSGVKYDDLELICRKGSQVEKFISIYQTNGVNGNGNGQKYNGKNIPNDTDTLAKSADFYNNAENFA
ncbi:MAG: hypothetical protein M3367_03230 [Acidobacteriota bacterium]|nr:hypothetical protein [Acidobacteriota bacterium]